MTRWKVAGISVALVFSGAFIGLRALASGTQVTELAPGSDPQGLVANGATLFFSANDGTHGRELWGSSGTVSTTSMIKDVNPGPSDGVLSVIVANATTLFLGNDGKTTSVWRSDGTPSGTSGSGISVLPLDYYAPIIPLGSSALYETGDGVLRKSDGTAAGTSALISAGSSRFARVLAVGNTVYFSATATVALHQTALWKTDGSAAGSQLVKDTTSAAQAREISGMAALGNTVFFVGPDGSGGNGLWKSDGTANGTALVTSMASNPGYIGASLTPVGNYIYFDGFDASAGWELWRTDGTAGGTIRVSDINPGPAGSRPVSNQFCRTIVGLSGIAYFFARDGVHGAELWRSDGTTAGTLMVSDVNPGAGDGISSNWNSALAAINGKVYFDGYDPIHGEELWATDGTTTALVKDINPGSNGSIPHYLTGVGTQLYFAADDGTHGSSLWVLGGP
jgi:ELWxxDGT repeat protein